MTHCQELKLVEEFLKIQAQEEEFPIQHFIDNREALKKAEVEGTYLLTEEVFGLAKKPGFRSGHLAFFQIGRRGALPGPGRALQAGQDISLCADRIQKILNKHGKIRDNASSALHQIRRSQQEKQGAVSKKTEPGHGTGPSGKDGWMPMQLPPTGTIVL